jgi:hypothetical protein
VTQKFWENTKFGKEPDPNHFRKGEQFSSSQQYQRMCRRDKPPEPSLMLFPGAASTIVKQLLAEQVTENATDKIAQAPGFSHKQEGVCRQDLDLSSNEQQTSSPQSSASEPLSASPQISINEVTTVPQVVHNVSSPGKKISSASVDAFLTFTLQRMFKHGE